MTQDPCALQRRGFLKQLALGCAGVLSVPLWRAAGLDSQSRAALRIVAASGMAHTITRLNSASLAPLLAEVLGSTSNLANDCERMLQLSDAQLRHWLAQRIQQDYQRGALVQHQGWWLARAEAAILQLARVDSKRSVHT